MLLGLLGATKPISRNLCVLIVGGMLLVLPCLKAQAQAKLPLDLLRDQAPALHQLYQQYGAYVPAFSAYAEKQRFTKPVVKLATIIHEMVHLASASHQGFYIQGIYYEPYLRRDAWPSLTNKDLGQFSFAHERGGIWTDYVRNTPENHLGNVVDEINAYGHVIEFVCRNEAESADGQYKNAIGLLHLQEIFLRATRLSRAAEYTRLLQNSESAGAMQTVTDRAWRALQKCGVRPDRIPDAEITLFLRAVRAGG